MVFQVKYETWLENKEIQYMIFCESTWTEETLSWTPELVFSTGPVGHSEVEVEFSVYYRFAESNYWLYKCLFSVRYSK